MNALPKPDTRIDIGIEDVDAEVDGQDQNEMVCTHRCYHGKINDKERLHRRVVNMVDFCLAYRTGYDIFCESLEWQALKLRNGLYNRQMY